MASKYCVVRYVPNPLTDERINVGVIAFDERKVLTRFLDRWNRVRHFADQDIEFLRHFADEITTATADQRQLGFGSTPTTLPGTLVETIASRWINSVQLSEPRASLASVEQTLDEVAAVFLSEGAERARAFRDHRYARQYLRRGVREALEQRVDQEKLTNVAPDRVEGLLAGREVRGNHQAHRFDVVIANGAIYGAGSGLSFEAREPKRSLQLAADAMAWSIDDVRQRDSKIPLAVVLLPPIASVAGDDVTRIYDQSMRIYRELRADVVAPNQVKVWAERVVSKIPL